MILDQNISTSRGLFKQIEISEERVLHSYNITRNKIQVNKFVFVTLRINPKEIIEIIKIWSIFIFFLARKK